MTSSLDTAPTFTATRGTDEHGPYDLADDLGDGPVVLAFFPGAFTPPCTNEMVALQDDLDRFEDAGATIVGVSADSAFSLAAFGRQHGIEFYLVSDMGRDAIEEYDLRIDIPELGLHGIANRAVFVVDDGGAITDRWIADDPTNEPDYDELIEAVEAARPTMVRTDFESEREYDRETFAARSVFQSSNMKVVLGQFEPGQFTPVHAPGSDVTIAPRSGRALVRAGAEEHEIEDGDVVVVGAGSARGISAIGDDRLEALLVTAPPPSDEDHAPVRTGIREHEFDPPA